MKLGKLMQGNAESLSVITNKEQLPRFGSFFFFLIPLYVIPKARSVTDTTKAASRTSELSFVLPYMVWESPFSSSHFTLVFARKGTC